MGGNEEVTQIWKLFGDNFMTKFNSKDFTFAVTLLDLVGFGSAVAGPGKNIYFTF